MQYIVTAFKCKVGSLLDLAPSMIPLGVISEGGDLYVVCLEALASEPDEEEESKEAASEETPELERPEAEKP